MFGKPIPKEQLDSNVWIIQGKEDGTAPDWHDAERFCIIEVDTVKEATQLVMAHLETIPGKDEIKSQRLAKKLLDY